MKIVINAGFGGFGLSAKATAAVMLRKGRPCYFFRQDISNGLSGPMIPLTIDEADAERLGFWHAYDIPNPNDKKEDDADKHYISCSDFERTDVDLIAVVAELGEAANGSCATLKIIDVPDDVEWDIDEYDGWERVAEARRTWG